MNTYAPIVSSKARLHLEWQEVLDALSAHSRGPLARAATLALDFPVHRRDLVERLRRVDEARALLDRGMSPPLGEQPDVRVAVSAAVRGGMIEPEDLRPIGTVLDAAARSRKFFSSFENDTPALCEVASGLAELPDLIGELQRCFDEKGEVADSASAELAQLRARVTSYHSRLKETVHGLLADDAYDGLLQDEYYTIRDERYVLPIRAGHKRHVQGVVHGWSKTGQTVFIEPQAVVEANNKLLLGQADVEREIRRILIRLSNRVGEQQEAILGSLSTLAELDFAFAAGALSRELDGHAPELVFDLVDGSAPHSAVLLELINARHPLLVLANVPVVPNTVQLNGQQRVLVVTGPNTGGKTVVLKMVGLCTLMAMAGLHVPADKGSRVPVVPGVFTDIGDAQSLARHLSTFSGHVTNIIEIFEKLEPGSLVLLDELMVGTDPIQGAALAQSILETLVSRGGLGLVTTHFESLKALPFGDDRFRNGAVGFDGQQRPTYRLSMDVPGASSALQTARRLGLEPSIVERAIGLAGPGQGTLERVIAQMEADAQAARQERTRLEEERHKLERSRITAENLERRLRKRMEEGVERERSRALTEARKLRDEVRSLQRSLRDPAKRKNVEQLEHHRGAAEQAIKKVIDSQVAAKRVAAGPPLQTSTLTLGDRVWVVSLGCSAVLKRLPDGRGRCEVQAGNLTCQVDAIDLRSSGDGHATPSRPNRAPPPAHKDRPNWESAPPQAPDNTIDLRGLRANEAVERAERFLDAQLERESAIAFLIHGHGTGALRREIRAHLRSSPYARDFRPGQPHEGGDGVTAVLLR